MARARNIKPGFFVHDTLADISPLGRLLFIGLWTIADFRGCLVKSPRKIKVQLLPYDNCDVDALLADLEKARFIRYYVNHGKTYIKITGFSAHQNPHKNERDAGSDIPDYQENINGINELTQDGTKPDLIGCTRADSLFLIPSSLIPDSPFPLPDSLNLIPDSLSYGAPPTAVTPATEKRLRASKAEKQPSATAETWKGYALAYAEKYGTQPVRNASVNAKLAQFVGRVGADEAPGIAAWFIGHRNSFYVQTGHSVGALLRDCEKLRTEWATGRHVTQTQAIQGDRIQTNLNAFTALIEEARKKESDHAEY